MYSIICTHNIGFVLLCESYDIVRKPEIKGTEYKISVWILSGLQFKRRMNASQIKHSEEKY